jgi:hypothetical protein
MSNPSSAPHPPFPPTTPPSRHREPIYAGVGVAVAVVVAVVVLVVAPALTHPGTTSVGPILTYAEARPIADQAVGNLEGGGWSLVFAAGLVSAATTTIPENLSALSDLNCSFTSVASGNNVTLPAYSGNRSSGLAPVWEFGYASLTNGIAIVSVVDGKGAVMGTLTGGECAYSGFVPSLPGTVIDSSQATAAAEPYARGFLAAHPNATAVFGLGPAALFGGSGTVATWIVLYNTCSTGFAPSATGSGFNATVNALTGEVLATHTSSNVTCAHFFVSARTVGPSPGTQGSLSPTPALRVRDPT